MRIDSRSLGKLTDFFGFDGVCLTSLARVAVRVNVYPGLPHVFWIFPEISASQTAWRDLLEGVKWLVGKI